MATADRDSATAPTIRPRRPTQILRRRRRGHASPPSASSTSTRTASSSPSRSRTTRARPSGRPTPLSTTSSPPGTTPTASRRSSTSSPRKGVFLDELAEQVGRDYDAFDLVCHVAFDQPPLTRRSAPNKVKKRNVFAKYGDKARAVLDALLDKYADGGTQQRRIARDSQSRPADRVRHAGRNRQALRRQDRATSPPSANSKPQLYQEAA